MKINEKKKQNLFFSKNAIASALLCCYNKGNIFERKLNYEQDRSYKRCNRGDQGFQG